MRISITRMPRGVLIGVMVLIFIAVGYASLGDVRDAIRYRAYDGEADALVESIETKEVPVRVRRHKRYRTELRTVYQTTYSYVVNGQEYRATTDWGMPIASDMGIYIAVRYNSDDPADNMPAGSQNHRILSLAFTLVELVFIASVSILVISKAKAPGGKTGGPARRTSNG